MSNNIKKNCSFARLCQNISAIVVPLPKKIALQRKYKKKPSGTKHIIEDELRIRRKYYANRNAKNN
jgi:hypothetical protein